jgi:putative ATP-binding cassette transporter
MYFGILGALIFLLPQLTGATAAILSGYALVVTNLMEPVGEILQALPQLTQANVALQKVQSLGLVLAGNIESTASKHFEALSLSECAPISNFQTLEFRQITYSYHQVDNGQPFVLGPINITIQRGELIFIVGGNGSGKSSFAKLITGLYTPEFGEIRVNHRLVLDGDREAYRQLFSTVFSDFYLFNRLFGVSSQNLDYQVSEYLKLLQLDHKVQVEAGVLSTINLSQGQRKRLALVAAYLEDRPIYLFDEWASDQDPYFREIFYKKLLPDLKQRGKTVLAISHDDRYFHVADRLIKLDYGKVV